MKPVITVGRNYPYNESYSHVLGYVAYASKNDLSSNKVIDDRHVPGLRVGKNGKEKPERKEGNSWKKLRSLSLIPCAYKHRNKQRLLWVR